MPEGKGAAQASSQVCVIAHGLALTRHSRLFCGSYLAFIPVSGSSASPYAPQQAVLWERAFRPARGRPGAGLPAPRAMAGRYELVW